MQELFDQDYQLRPGSNPVQYDVRFNAFADQALQPILDRVKASESRLISNSMADMNGYLPTHMSERSHAQGPDPVWNDANCRNRRILIDDVTQRALDSDRTTLSTYRLERGDEIMSVKNVFVPLVFGRRRWGNYEIAYRDD